METAKPAPNMPVEKNKAETIPDFRGPYFSTYLPRNAADIPKKKIARLKAHCTSRRVTPISAITGLVKTLQA
ncbi:hypothetical protein SDC9_88008 [bioreactor metagenome]|uniref:Uncharacterized protein n=1 Tax=bioreactor metagenome TaxID=1076179 RepID=A0A644ZRT0_9ZZZZ